MIEQLLELAHQIDAALKSNISPVSKIFVIFVVWFCGAVIMSLLGVLGSYTTGWLIFISVFALVVWTIVCIIMGGIATKDVWD